MNTPVYKKAVMIGGLCLALPLSALAAPPGMDGPPPQGAPAGHGFGPPEAMPPLPPFLHRLELSEAQQDRVFALVHAEAPVMRNLAKTLDKSEAALRELSRSAAFDLGRAREIAENGGRAMAQLALIRARLDNQIFQLLTPEQRRQAEDFPADSDGAPADRPPRRPRRG